MKSQFFPSVGTSLRFPTRLNGWAACLLALVILIGAPSFASTITVTNTNDSGPGSLRDAIATATSGDRIQFGVTGSISLTSGSLTVDLNLTIAGPGAAQLTLRGDGESPVFLIGTVQPSAVTAISGLTIQNGGGGTVNTRGGGIYNEGTLTLTDCSVLDSSNGFYDGGGIYNGGTLTLVRSTVSGNDAFNGFGGGIYNGSTLTLVNSTVSDNDAFNGAGIFNDGTLTLTNSTVSGNSVGISSGGSGGGILNEGTATLNKSTVSGNQADLSGGGIFSERGTLNVTNSTIANNTASFNGGAIANSNGSTIVLVSSTLAANSAGDQGGGIYDAGALTVKSTLLANNVMGNCYLDDVPATSLGYNLADDGTCSSFFTVSGDENSVTAGAGLSPNGLRNNGGPTQTIALLRGSPAVNHIPVANCTDALGKRITTDQRGVARPQGAACDTGAFELIPTVPFASFSATLAIQTGQPSGFELQSSFTLASSTDAFDPRTKPVMLSLAKYTVDVPAGSFQPLWNSPSAPYVYEGTINGTKLVMGFIPMGGEKYQFNAVGSPVSFGGVTNPVDVSLTVGSDTGSATIKALITNP